MFAVLPIKTVVVRFVRGAVMERVRAVEFTGYDRMPIGAVRTFSRSLVGCHYILSPKAIDHHIIKTMLSFSKDGPSGDRFGNEFIGIHMVGVESVV